jgi:hypothetical protein
MAENMPTLAECEQATVSEYEIGEGRDRTGYHIPGSKWVYKIQRYSRSNANQREIIRYEQLINSSNVPDGIAFPEMHILENGVIAAEYIEGREPDDQEMELVYKLEDIFGMYDSSASCNIRVVETENVKTVYIIDLAE